MHFEPAGAFTGEVSAPMLGDLGVDAVVLGHSERRHLFGESDATLARKVPAALSAGLSPILCVGETLEEREAGRTDEVLRRQIEADLAGAPPADLAEVVIAYEPVWAIGTGRNATVEQAAEAISFIRSLLGARDQGAAEAVRILYGGSVNSGNAPALLEPEAIDGALVGGASLDPDEFAAIAAAAKS
jgi:triosephosphate isomerase